MCMCVCMCIFVISPVGCFEGKQRYQMGLGRGGLALRQANKTRQKKQRLRRKRRSVEGTNNIAHQCQVAPPPISSSPLILYHFITSLRWIWISSRRNASYTCAKVSQCSFVGESRNPLLSPTAYVWPNYKHRSHGSPSNKYPSKEA